MREKLLISGMIGLFLLALFSINNFESPIPAGTTPITGLSAQVGAGEDMVLFNPEKSRTTMYYTPIDIDFEMWYNPAHGTGLESIEYCGWNSFYASVRCEGSGIAYFDGQPRVCRYFSILPSKDASKPACYVDPEHSRGTTASGTNPTPKKTLACPDELDFGQEIFIDFGEDNDWTGCYICEDKGSAIVGNHFDVYVGVSKKALSDASLPDWAWVYLGCGSVPPRPVPEPVEPPQPSPEPEPYPEPAEEQIAPEPQIKIEEKLPEDTEAQYHLIAQTTATLDYDLSEYQLITTQAQEILDAVEDCKQLATAHGDTADIAHCIRMAMPSNWELDQNDGEFYAFSVKSNSPELTHYDTETGKTEQRPIIYKFAMQIN